MNRLERLKQNRAKKKVRAVKKKNVIRAQVAALPKIPQVIIDSNYVNPITLNFPKNVVVYELRNRKTGRKNYYDKKTFWALMKMVANDYKLLMMDPKLPLFRNPVTRGNIYPRNVRRVTVKPKMTKSVAAKKIQNAVRKHLKKKKASKK